MVSIQSTLTGDLKNSIFDGIFANMFATLTGGLFLTGLALYLGMNEFMIGLLSAMPFLTTLFQLPTSYYLGIKNRRKAFTTYGALAARLIWLPVLVIAVIPGLSVFSKSIVVLLLIFINPLCPSASFRGSHGFPILCRTGSGEGFSAPATCFAAPPAWRS